MLPTSVSRTGRAVCARQLWLRRKTTAVAAGDHIGETIVAAAVRQAGLRAAVRTHAIDLAERDRALGRADHLLIAQRREQRSGCRREPSRGCPMCRPASVAAVAAVGGDAPDIVVDARVGDDAAGALGVRPTRRPRARAAPGTSRISTTAGGAARGRRRKGGAACRWDRVLDRFMAPRGRHGVDQNARGRRRGRSG